MSPAKMSPHISIGPEPGFATHAPSLTAVDSHSCSKWWDLQDSDQQPIQGHEGVNPAKKPGEQSRCETMSCPILAKA